jgi:iron-sulfur cluster repair protein YtfE (RIC family)
MDVLDHLTEEHRKAEKLIDELESTEPGKRRDRLVGELTEALRKHMAVEEHFLYPLVQDVMGDEPETEAEVEHSLARDGLAKLDELRHRPGFGAALDMVKAGISHHVHEEESEIFPELRKKAGPALAALDPEQLESQIEDLEQSRDALYQRAKKARIPGRSAMTKDQLAEAVSSAED